MGNSTKFLKRPSMNHVSDLVFDQNFIDFSVENVAIAGTIDVLAVPAGAIILACGVHAVTHEDTVEYKLSLVDSTGATDVLGTVAHTADNQNKAAGTVAANMTCNSLGGTLRVTIAAANATVAKVTPWVLYGIIKNIA